MELRRLGRSNLYVPPLVFGGNVFGWTVDRDASFALLDRMAAAGLNAIDTADVYGRWVEGNVGGESEIIIGDWMRSRGRRERTVLITKVGWDMGEAGKGLSAAHIESAVEASLRRLRTDYIDLYLSHLFDSTVPLEETLRAHDRLLRAGKVRAIGASNHSATQLRAALDVSAAFDLPRYEVLQPMYNLYDRSDFDGALRELTMAEGIGVITFCSLASGFLTGKYRSVVDLGKSPRGGRVHDYMDERGFRILAALDAVAARHPGARPAVVALAWLMMRPGVSAPIVSATNPDQLQCLIAATTLRLSPDDIAALDEASRD